METTVADQISTFLNSSFDNRTWHDAITSVKEVMTAKCKFRAKCLKFEIVGGTLHYKHKKHGNLRVVAASEKDQILHACHFDPAGPRENQHQILLAWLSEQRC